MLTRPAVEADIPYVLDSFTKAYAASPYSDRLSRVQVRQLMVTLLQKSDWNCSVLCVEDEPTEILAYCVWRSPQEVAWLQRKHIYYGQRLGRQLLDTIGTDLTQPTFVTFMPSARYLGRARSAGQHLIHHPYLGIV